MGVGWAQEWPEHLCTWGIEKEDPHKGLKLFYLLFYSDVWCCISGLLV